MSAPRHARPFVAVFVAALAICAAVPLNPWPFSNWELFSRLRTDRQLRWEEVAVTSTGHRSDYLLSSLPHGYAIGAADCAEWVANATAKLGRPTRAVGIYRVNWLLTDRRGRRAAPPRRTLELTCVAKKSHAGS
jgi:hypothetical protein